MNMQSRESHIQRLQLLRHFSLTLAPPPSQCGMAPFGGNDGFVPTSLHKPERLNLQRSNPWTAWDFGLWVTYFGVQTARRSLDLRLGKPWEAARIAHENGKEATDLQTLETRLLMKVYNRQWRPQEEAKLRLLEQVWHLNIVVYMGEL